MENTVDDFDTEQLIKWLSSGLRSGALKHRAAFNEQGGIIAVTIALASDDKGEEADPRRKGPVDSRRARPI